MKRIVLALIAMAAMSSTQAMTDWECVNQCRTAGMGWNYCNSICEY